MTLDERRSHIEAARRVWLRVRRVSADDLRFSLQRWRTRSARRWAARWGNPAAGDALLERRTRPV